MTAPFYVYVERRLGKASAWRQPHDSFDSAVNEAHRLRAVLGIGVPVHVLSLAFTLPPLEEVPKTKPVVIVKKRRVVTPDVE